MNAKGGAVLQVPSSDLVLIIDDEPQIRHVVRNALSGLSVRSVEASTGAAGVELAASARPSLVILDLGLPDRDGADVCRELRSFTTAPIIILSARHSDREKEALLDAGADDYVTKPFSTIELGARIRVQLRRAAATGGDGRHAPVLTVDGLTIDLVGRSVHRSEGVIHLTPTEWALLRVFVAHAGRTLTHTQLYRAAWGADAAGDAQQNLRVYVSQLRRKLERDPMRPLLIRTESSIGYRFDLEQ